MIKQKSTNFELADGSDQCLIAQANHGDQKALAQLVKKYLKLVFYIAKNYINDSDEAEDITQEVFVKIWKNLKKYNPQNSFKSWLVEITKNTCLDWLKKKKAIPFSDFNDQYGKNYICESLADPALNPYEQAAKKSFLEIAKNRIARLNFVYQQTLIMHHEKEMTFQEIADQTNQSINTVKSRYRRALNSLKK
jgi:RNA polymerase sigma-70 factor (ECF subfamily)